MALRESFLGKWYYAILRHLFILRLRDKEILSPEKITLIGVILSILVPLGFYFSPILGTFFILMSAIPDSLDGQLARKRGEESLYGAFLDSTLDRVSDYFYLLGFWVYALKYDLNLAITILFSMALMLTLLFSYAKARIEGLGSNCSVGFMERAARVIFLLGWGVVITIFSGISVILLGIIVYNILLLFSVCERISCAKKTLAKK